MDVIALDLPEVKVVRPRRFRDQRGFFSEIYNQTALQEAGVATAFIQDNFSFSLDRGVVRGLHFQIPPAAQAKLVMVLSGRVFDVAVDCRKGSATFGQHVTAELSSEAWNQIFVPVGFAHGFCTLEPNTSVLYKVTAPYEPRLDSGIAWDDPDLGIAWPVDRGDAILSEKDMALPRFRDLPNHFAVGRRA
jgi:dTDP-4-dehydrorhamnose 3,5-epimerase